MKTKSKPRHLNLTAAQARHLHETGSLLVVVPCKPQPVDGERIVFDSRTGEWSAGSLRDSENAWRDIKSPLGKPGDVVLCREPWKFFDKTHARVIYTATDGFSKGSYRTSTMPELAIRLRPVLATVECRRVDSLKHDEAVKTGYAGHYDYRLGYWHRRYRRRGPEYAFECAWGFFYILTKE